MEQNMSSVILHYVGLAARELTEKDPIKLEEIAREKEEIAEALGMTTAEIIERARSLIGYTKNE